MNIDTKHLSPGKWISQHECEVAIGFTKEHDSERWQLAMLRLMDIVRKQLRQQHGRDLTLRILGREIHILTDEQASEYNPKRFEDGLRLARRSHRRLLAVNVANLSAEQRDLHAKSVANQAHKLSMLRQRSDVAIQVAERKTPLMTFGNRKRE